MRPGRTNLSDRSIKVAPGGGWEKPSWTEPMRPSRTTRVALPRGSSPGRSSRAPAWLKTSLPDPGASARAAVARAEDNTEVRAKRLGNYRWHDGRTKNQSTVGRHIAATTT